VDVAKESADIIICPSLESCNFAVKLAIFYTHRPWAGIVVGGGVPVVMGSRADPALNRVYAIAMAQLVAAGRAAQLRETPAGGHG
jgi:phosphotransacetylase